MQISLELRCDKGSILPFNHQYEVSSWIYKLLATVDAHFAELLHDEGYTEIESSKDFKFFTFSKIEAKSPYSVSVADKGIIIDSGYAELRLAFHLQNAAENFVQGLFQDQRLRIVARDVGRIDFRVETVHRISPPNFSRRMSYELKNPLVLTRRNADSRHAEYLAPNDDEYLYYLIKNLLEKRRHLRADASDLNIEEVLGESSLRMLSKPRSKLITIKQGTREQVRVKGYEFRFELETLPELHELGYTSGFGSNNSQGFGCVRIRM